MPVGGVMIGQNVRDIDNVNARFLQKLTNSHLFWRQYSKDPDFMNAIAASEVAMNAVVSSEETMNAIAASEIAIDAVLNSFIARDVVFVSELARKYLWTSLLFRSKFYLSGLREEEIPYFVELLKWIQSTTPIATNIPVDSGGVNGVAGCKLSNGTYYFPYGYNGYYYTTTDFVTYTGFDTGVTSGRVYDIAFQSDGTIVIVNDYNLRFNVNEAIYVIPTANMPANTITAVGATYFPTYNWTGYWKIAWNASQIEYAWRTWDDTDGSTSTTIISSLSDLSAVTYMNTIALLDENYNEISFGLRHGANYWE